MLSVSFNNSTVAQDIGFQSLSITLQKTSNVIFLSQLLKSKHHFSLVISASL